MKRILFVVLSVILGNHSVVGQDNHAPTITAFSALSTPFDPYTKEHYSPEIIASLKHYTLVHTHNESGEINDSRLQYQDSTLEQEDELALWVVTISHTGEQERFSMQLATVRANYNFGLLPPTDAPSWLFGTTEYYKWRETDFQLRNFLSNQQLSPPNYYLNYGDKYSVRFTEKIRPKLSEKGQEWLDKTLVLLQLSTEALLMKDRSLELDPIAYRKQLFALHPHVYETAGFFELSFRDFLMVVTHLDVKDTISKEGRLQVKKLGKLFVFHVLSNKMGVNLLPAN